MCSGEDPRLKAVWVAVAGLFIAGLIWIGGGPGFLVDDLYSANFARSWSWTEILFWKLGTYPSVPPYWKIAIWLSPEEPYRWVRVWIACMHGLNGVFVFLLAKRMFDGSIALWLPILFVMHRPGSESVLWAAGSLEVQMTTLLLGSLLLWMNGISRGRLLWPAVGLAAMAMIFKISALLFPAVLATAACALARRTEWPRLGAWVAILAVVNAALLVVSVWRSDSLHAASAMAEGVAGVSALPVLAGSILRLFLLVNPSGFPGPYPVLALTLGVFTAAGWVIWRGSPAARMGIVWVMALLSFPVIVRGIAQPRYEYAAAFGAILIVGALIEWVRERTPLAGKAVMAGVGLWLAVNAGLYVRDAATNQRCGLLNIEARNLLAASMEKIRDAGGLTVINRPPVVRHTDILEYDHRLPVAVRFEPHCPDEAQFPCLIYPRRVNVASECPSEAEFPFARWDLAH